MSAGSFWGVIAMVLVAMIVMFYKNCQDAQAIEERWKVYRVAHHCVPNESWEHPSRYTCDHGETVER